MKPTKIYQLLAIIIFLIGACLRFYNLNFDRGAAIQPDENLIVGKSMAVEFFRNLNPGFFDYNGVPVYLLSASRQTLSTLNLINPKSITDNILTGRYLSALFSALSVIFVFLIALKLWNIQAAVIAELFFALSVLSVQQAHFYITDNLITFFLLGVIYSGINFYNSGKLRHLLICALFSGLALGSKNTAVLFILFPILLIFSRKSPKLNKLYLAGIFSIFALTFFLISSPYTLINWQEYLSRSLYLSNIAAGRLVYDWSLEFAGTNALFWLPNIFWAAGPVLPILALSGIGYFPFKRKNPELLLIIWTIGFSVVIFGSYLKFIRYLLPLIPVYSLFAGFIGYRLLKLNNPGGRILFLLIFFIHLMYLLAFISIYINPFTAATAANYISANIAPRSVILKEDWNASLRYELEPLIANHYQVISFNFYSSETNDKFLNLSDYLSRADYIVIESPKVKNTVLRHRSDFPKTAQFYQDLEAGNLGYSLLIHITSYPALGRFTLNDENSEETFTVFDHPGIRIYQKSPNYNPEAVRLRMTGLK